MSQQASASKDGSYEKMRNTLEEKFVIQEKRTFFRTCPKSKDLQLFFDGVIKILAKVVAKDAEGAGYYLLSVSSISTTRKVCLPVDVFCDIKKFLAMLNAKFKGGDFICGGEARNKDLKYYITWLKDRYNKTESQNILSAAPYIGYLKEYNQWVLNDQVQLSHTGFIPEDERTVYTFGEQLTPFYLDMEPDLITDYNFFKDVFRSCSSIKAVFLDFFQYNKPYYDKANTLPTFSISTDHTFKSAKPIGGYTLDGKFVKDLNKLFIILSENDKVVDWQLTKTNSQAEVRPILDKLDAQLKGKNHELKFIFADLCCEWVAFYTSIFPDSKTKLDLFHACQRVCKVVPHKKTIEALKFMKEFGLIFRQVGDLSDFRCLTTDTIENILKNLDMFLEGQSKYLETMVTVCQKKIILNEIDKIRNHVVRGCLSGIPPGCGTESNERLHRMLNRSFLRGSTLISPELAQAVLTLIFYSYNEDRRENGQVFSLLPVFHKPFSTIAKDEYTELTSKGKLQTSTLQINGFDNLVKSILKRTRIVISNISKVSNLCKNKILKEQLLMHLHFDSKVSESFQDVSFEFHCHTLKRNLASFGLTEDEVCADGDCLFRSITLQLKKKLNASMADSPLKFHLSNIGINLDQDDIDIIMKLRNRFVDTLTTSITLKPFLTKADLYDASNFRKSGVFASNVGDLVVDVVCDIIGMTIVIVSSSSLVDVSVHCPKDKQYAEQPIFISYNRFGSGHYNSTKDMIEVTDDPNVRCNCRRNVNDKMPCNKQDSSSRCPCVQRNTSCSKKCYCRCCNNKTFSLEVHNMKCMCGKNNKTSTASCTDKSGLRASKCPCLRSGKACNSTCKCKNCANDFGVKEKESINENDLVVSRKPRRDTIYKPLRVTEYMLKENKELVEGPWTLVETSCLVCCINVVKCLDPDASYDNIATVFNQVVVSPSLSLFDLVLRTKSCNQIRAKLDHLKKWKS